jgi:hypothetical protein
MRSVTKDPIRAVAFNILLSLLLASSLGLAQNPSDEAPPAQAPAQPQSSAPDGVWRHFPKASDQPAAQSAMNYPGAPSPSQNQGSATNAAGRPSVQNDSQEQALPTQLTVKPGTFVTVRVNQFLSSDRNQAGDAFSATLARPLVVNGVIVAQRGETVGGWVVEAKKAGLVKGVSRLALELTDLTLVDGQQVPIHTQLSGRNGPTSVGRDASAVAGTTALGAAVGAAADWGKGAAIGAGAGAIAGTLGVLLTRGRPTEIYPESLLTFRIQDQVMISTVRAPQAFRYVDPNDYQQANAQGPPPQGAPPCAGYGCPPPYYYGAPYYYPYYWGPGFGFWYGPRFYWGRRFYGGGFRFRR